MDLIDTSNLFVITVEQYSNGWYVTHIITYTDVEKFKKMWEDFKTNARKGSGFQDFPGLFQNDTLRISYTEEWCPDVETVGSPLDFRALGYNNIAKMVEAKKS